MKSVREDNQRLSQSVAEMRAERRAQDRKIRDLEHQLALIREQGPRGEGGMPQLPVEVVAPPASSETHRVVAIAEDGTEIVYEGDAALGKPAVVELPPARRVPSRIRHDAPAPVERDVPRRPPAVSARTSRTAAPRDGVRDVGRAADSAGSDYRAAVELVMSGSKDEAIAALRAFLVRYPRHDYADNAQYWLGEAHYAHKEYQHALVEFRATIETYPRGNKVPDALLKVGYCYLALGQTEKARAVLEQVVNLYPRSEPAALAAKRLEMP
jgi:tol-pal system protein YbgF